jgi:hypothetical protein
MDYDFLVVISKLPGYRKHLMNRGLTPILIKLYLFIPIGCHDVS